MPTFLPILLIYFIQLIEIVEYWNNMDKKLYYFNINFVQEIILKIQ